MARSKRLGYWDVLALFDRAPALTQLNAVVYHKDYRESELHSK
jgi:hypothetical protein